MQIVNVFGGERIPLSYEIFPPKGELPMEEARNVVAELAKLDPAFVSVTYSAGGGGNNERTSEIAQMGQDTFNLNMMAHLTCMGATREDIAASIALLKERGVQNVLALRGDPIPGKDVCDFKYAKDLIPTLREAGFCVGAAAYPEGHAACLDLDEDVRHLKEKQDAGAQFFVTQLFFDNRFAYKFLDKCRAARIRVPITFGIMPFMSKAQVSRMIFMCGASLPSPLVKVLARWEHDPDGLRKAGIEYACQQLIGLVEHGVDGVHLYSMNKPDVAREIATAVRPYL
ncbi:MAG: methylenetetrahydrofolate reductase [Coriobacteriaceae bacterium]|nr:methylenetetrahydrofolate reductase [Coriobacteriaceae bacterium]